MSIIFFRFFLLFSVVANRVGPKTRYHRACSRSLTSLVLSRSLRFAAKILYEIMLVRIFCNFSFFFTQFFWLMGWVVELFWGFLRFQLFFSGFFSAIVHYANLVLLNKYTFLTKVGTRAPGTGGAHVLSFRRIAKQFRYC